MESFHEGSLRIDVELRECALILHWTGTSNACDPDAQLRAFFEAVADEATRNRRRVELRLHVLHDLDAVTIAAMTRAVRRLRAQNTHVRVAFSDDERRRRPSLDALRVLLAGD